MAKAIKQQLLKKDAAALLSVLKTRFEKKYESA